MTVGKKRVTPVREDGDDGSLDVFMADALKANWKSTPAKAVDLKIDEARCDVDAAVRFRRRGSGSTFS